MPRQSERVDHEVELVLGIGEGAATFGGRHVPEHEALRLLGGFAVGIDVTARDLQEQAKKKALPWAIAKGFDTFAVLGDFQRASEFSRASRLQLRVNGALRQEGALSEMVFSPARLISFLSSIFTLAPGDLIFTGTPAGVGPLTAGDRVEASLLTEEGGMLSRIDCRVSAETRENSG